MSSSSTISLIRETPILFDFELHKVFNPIIVQQSTPAHELSLIPGTLSHSTTTTTTTTHQPFDGPRAGIAMYDPHQPPVHWYLEPQDQPYLPLSKARATWYNYPPTLGSRLTLIFPGESPKLTREVTLILTDVRAVFVGCISIPPSIDPCKSTSSFQILDLILVAFPDSSILSIRIKVPKFVLDPLPTTFRNRSSSFSSYTSLPDSIQSCAIFKTIIEFRDRHLYDAVLVDSHLFLAYSGSSFPEVIAMTNSWTNMTNDCSQWTNEVSYVVCTPHHFNLQRTITNWFNTPNTISLAVVYLLDRTFIASLTNQGFLCVMDSKDLMPIYKVELKGGHATSIHFLSAPGNTSAHLAYRTSSGSWHVTSLDLDDTDTISETVIKISLSEITDLPAITTAFTHFLSAKWLSSSLLIALYSQSGLAIPPPQEPFDGSGSSHGLIAIRLDIKDPMWTEMVLSDPEHGTGLQSARARGLINFCNEYHVSAAVPVGKLLTVDLVAQSFTAMNPNVSIDSVRQSALQYITQSLTYEVLPLTLVHVTNHYPLSSISSTTQDQGTNNDPLFTGMVAVIKKSGFGIIRQSTTVADMYQVLQHELDPCMDFPIVGVHYGFASVWRMADNVIRMAVKLLDASSGSGMALDRMICAAPEQLLTHEFSEAVEQFINTPGNNWVKQRNHDLIYGQHVTGMHATIAAAMDALSVLALRIPNFQYGLILPHVVVPLLHDILLDQQLLARAVVIVCLYMSAIDSEGQFGPWPTKSVLERLKDLFRMPDLLVPEALPFLTLSLTVPAGMSVDTWTNWQLADAVRKSKSWSIEQMAQIIVSAPESAVNAILNSLDENQWPGNVLYALHRVSVYSVQHQRSNILLSVDSILACVFDQVTDEHQADTLPSMSVDVAMDLSTSNQSIRSFVMPSTLPKECTGWYLSAEYNVPILQDARMVVIDTIASILMEKNMYVGAGRLIRGIATALQKTLKTSSNDDPNDLYQLHDRLEQVIIMAFHASIKTKDLSNAIQSLTQYMTMLKKISESQGMPMPPGKVLTQVAVLVDILNPEDLRLLATPSPLAPYIIRCLNDRLANIQPFHHHQPISTRSSTQSEILAMLASVFAYHMNDIGEAANFAYKVAVCEWRGACQLVSPVPRTGFDTNHSGGVSAFVISQVSIFAQRTLDALFTTIQYLDKIHVSFKKSMSFVLLPNKYQQNQHCTDNTLDVQRHLVSKFDIQRQLDELQCALFLHNTYSDSSILLQMVQQGMPVDNGLVICKDYSLIPDVILKLKSKTNNGEAKGCFDDFVAKYSELVRQDTGMHMDEWLKC